MEQLTLTRVRNLLARIHGDGGHYVEQHGLDKALEDAEAKVVRWSNERAVTGWSNTTVIRDKPGEMRTVGNHYCPECGDYRSRSVGMACDGCFYEYTVNG